MASDLLDLHITSGQPGDKKCRISIRPKKKDSCVQVSEVKKIRVGRSKNIFILDFFFHYKCTEVLIEDRALEVSFFTQIAH